MRDLRRFVEAMPKVELHVHHLGATPLSTLATLAERHPAVGLSSNLAVLPKQLAVTNMASFFSVYRLLVELVRTPTDVYESMTATLGALAERHVNYAEITVSPFSSVKRGVPIPAFVEAIQAARADAAAASGIDARWIFDIPRPDHEAATATLEAALTHGPSELVALGLAGVESGGRLFGPYFAQARAHGLKAAPHAGESLGPSSVWTALRDLKADRIGHATCAPQDAALLDHLADREIPVEVCITSNQITGAVGPDAIHPVVAMREAGVRVSINTDDPTLFGCTLDDELLTAADLLALSPEDLLDLQRDAVLASFAPPHVRATLLATLEAHRSWWLTHRADELAARALSTSEQASPSLE